MRASSSASLSTAARTRSISLVALVALVLSVLPVFAGGSPAEAATEERFSDPGPGFVVNETGEPGRDIYIVLHQAPSLARYRGEVPGLAATAPDVTGADRLDPSSAATVAYLGYLETQQDTLLADIEAAVGRSVEVASRYNAVLNGFAARITAEEAEIVASLPGVRHVERDSRLELHTDNGPRWIGADAIWG
ncbi:MAG: protease inhibitor I9 family protein, partial [Acidimicrobiia bacterium]